MRKSQKCHLPSVSLNMRARDFGEPIINAGEDLKTSPADKHEMEMADHEIGIVKLPVERTRPPA